MDYQTHTLIFLLIEMDCHLVVAQDLVDFKYHVNIKNSLRYAIQEMRRQSKLLHSVQKLCSTIPEVEGGKIGKVRGHLEHVCKELEKDQLHHNQTKTEFTRHKWELLHKTDIVAYIIPSSNKCLLLQTNDTTVS